MSKKSLVYLLPILLNFMLPLDGFAKPTEAVWGVDKVKHHKQQKRVDDSADSHKAPAAVKDGAAS